jgi:hypothetical protein
MINLAINPKVLELLRANAATFGWDINDMICSLMARRMEKNGKGDLEMRAASEWLGLACMIEEEKERDQQ